MARFAIILQAGTETHEGLARATHALLYSKDLMEQGHQVRLIFDGAGTAWVPELMKPSHQLHPLFSEVRSKKVIDAICDFCAGAFGVRKAIQGKGLPLDGAFKGHPSLAKHAADGGQILIL